MDARQHQYDTVSLTDDSTEVDESLMGDEKPWHRPRAGQRPGRKSGLRLSVESCRWLVDTFLLLVILGLLVLLLLQDRRRGAPAPAPATGVQVGGDYAGTGPTFPTKVVKFEQDMTFSPMDESDWFSAKTLDRWNTLMPAGTGWGPSNQTFFTTSMTHQLHCVFMMGRIFSGVVANMSGTLPSDWHFHFMHCVDYLRQSVMCSADLSMEPHEPSDADGMGPLDGGWNGHHVCKDYGQVTGYLEGQIKDGVRVVLPIDD